MTCIIGALCKDGAVIISDKRVLRGEYNASNESKYHLIFDGNVVVAGAGNTATLDYFNEKLNELNSDAQTDLKKAIQNIEDSLIEIKQRYYARIGRDFEFEAIVGCLENIENGEPHLRVVYSSAVSEKIKTFQIIGHGTPFVTTIFRLMYNQNLSLIETAVLGYFSILAVISMGIDQTMGVDEKGPDVLIIKKDQKPEKINTETEEFKKAFDSATKLNFNKLLINGIWKTMPDCYK